MTNVMEREQKKIKGWIESRKGFDLNNGRSAAKPPYWEKVQRTEGEYLLGYCHSINNLYNGNLSP